MSKFKFIGWCNENGHDKVWGVILLEAPSSVSTWNGSTQSKCVTFWGRRGAKLQTKLRVDDWELYKLIESKKDKGYIDVDETKLNEVYPEFEKDLSKTAFWASFKI